MGTLDSDGHLFLLFPLPFSLSVSLSDSSPCQHILASQHLKWRKQQRSVLKGYKHGGQEKTARDHTLTDQMTLNTPFPSLGNMPQSVKCG